MIASSKTVQKYIRESLAKKPVALSFFSHLGYGSIHIAGRCKLCGHPMFVWLKSDDSKLFNLYCMKCSNVTDLRFPSHAAVACRRTGWEEAEKVFAGRGISALKFEPVSVMVTDYDHDGADRWFAHQPKPACSKAPADSSAETGKQEK